MNIVLECDVTLSKKLEAICEQGEPISIFISAVNGNRGRAMMRIVCKDKTADADIAKVGETSIQFKVVSASEDVRSMSDGSRFTNLMSSTGGGLPPATEPAVARTTPDRPTLVNNKTGLDNSGAAFASPPPVPKDATAPQNPLEALANNPALAKILLALTALAGGQQAPDVAQVVAAATAAAQPQPAAPQAAPARPPPPRDNCVRSYEELVSEITAIPGIDQDIRMPTDRKLTRNEADQILARMPRLRRKAFVRNLMQQQLLIGDLYTTLDGSGACLALLPGQAFDLTRLPAKNILNSSDFKWCVDTNKVDFVTSAEYAASFKRTNDEAARWAQSELPVYGGETARMAPSEPSGGVAESLASGAALVDDGSEIRIGPSGPDPISLNVENSGVADAPPTVVYEESPEMQNLLSSLPTAKAAPVAQPRRMR